MEKGSKTICWRALAAGISLIAVMIFERNSWAIATPAAGSFAYEVYDIAVLKLLQGPVGFVGGVGAMVFGAISAIRGQIMGAVPAILGGAVLLKADSVVTSLGMLF